MHHLPFFHQYDPAKKQLTLRGAKYFPSEVFEFHQEIEILDMSQGFLSVLPDDFPRLAKLRIAFFSQNHFEKVPAVLSECENLSMVGFKSCRLKTFPENSLPSGLQWLILTDNQLEKLPTSIGELSQLQKFALAGNRLSKLPEQMANCSKLELLRLGANDFRKAPPEWLFNLPSLAWYGDSGNPFSQGLGPKLAPITIPHTDIEYGPRIGGSPTSDVFKGRIIQTGKEIAIKEYKGKFTSDGYAADDIRASVAAGSHPNLIEVLGKVAGKNPNESLALALLPADFKNLGLPPTLATCTRDTFPEKTSFTLEFILNALLTVSSAMKHLHERGITHGDLYAHNILSDKSGRSILGDFGAASFIAPTNTLAKQVESRSFGYLIDDLLVNTEPSTERNVIEGLQSVQNACLSTTVSERPFADEIENQLQQICGAYLSS